MSERLDHVTDRGEPASVAAPVPGKRSFLKRAGVIATTVISIVGAVASVIAIVQVFTRDTTNFSHLSLAAAPASTSVTEWAVGEDQLAALPTDLACTPQLQEWLAEHATELHRSFALTMRNGATEGAMLALTDLRSTATVAGERGSLSVRLVCDPAGVLPQRLAYGRVAADRPEAVAEHVLLEAGAPPNSAPTIPVTYNLAPGEVGTLVVELFSRMPATGALEATVLSGSAEQVVAIPDTDFTMPALLFSGEMYLYTTDEGLACQQTEAATIVSCTMAELATEVRTAQR